MADGARYGDRLLPAGYHRQGNAASPCSSPSAGQRLSVFARQMRSINMALQQCGKTGRLAAAAILFSSLLSINGYAQTSWPLWESYSRTIIDQQGRVIDRSAQDKTTSEGQSYAMFFALV